MEQPIIFKELKWDSDFFGRKTASLRCAASTSEQLLRKELQRAREGGFELVYLILEEDSAQQPQLDLGCEHRLVDVKYTFGCVLKEHPLLTADTEAVKPYDSKAEGLYGLAFQAGEHSRYRLDPKFGKGEFERFYRTWAQNSLNGQMADTLFVVGEPVAPLGFVTLKRHAEEASIGLIAIAEGARGAGLGRQLVAQCLKEAHAWGCRRLTVATQQQNEQACAFYRRCGMALEEQCTIYHCWL